MNPEIPVVEINLDRPRHLKYNFGAFAAMERASGRKFVGPGSGETWQALRQPGADNLLLLLYGGLVHEDPALTFQAAGELLTFDNAEYVDGLVAEAIAPVLKRAFKVEDNRPPKAIAQDGPNCGLSPDTTSASQTPNSGS